MIVEISARTITIPRHCACCGAEPAGELTAVYTRTTGKRVIRTDSRGWDFPYCGRCLAHVHAWNHPDALTIAGLVLASLGTALALGTAGFSIAFVTGLGLFGIAGVLFRIHRARVKREMCSPACSYPDAAVSFLGWDGSIQAFDLASPRYAAMLALANERKLINFRAELRSAVEMLLREREAEDYPVRREAAAPSRPAHAGADPADIVLKWVAKIESLKGPVSRRNALDRGLAEIADAHQRDALLLAASQIEVRAVLDKVDGLKSVAAKRRNLEESIAQLRGDDVPDELQRREIEILEAALGDLEG